MKRNEKMAIVLIKEFQFLKKFVCYFVKFNFPIYLLLVFSLPRSTV